MNKIKNIDLRSVQDALYVISGKWKFPIIYSLCHGAKRFNQLQADVEGITPKMLAKELEALLCNKLVERISTSNNTVLYALSSYGKTVEPVMRSLQEWGKKHRKKVAE